MVGKSNQAVGHQVQRYQRGELPVLIKDRAEASLAGTQGTREVSKLQGWRQAILDLDCLAFTLRPDEKLSERLDLRGVRSC